MDLTIDLRRTPQTPPEFLSDVRVRVFHSDNLKEVMNVIGMVDWTKAKFVGATILWGEELEDARKEEMGDSTSAGS